MRHCDAMPTSTASDLLTASQVGTLIGRSGRTVIRMAENGLIPIAAKLPGPTGAYLFSRADAETLLVKATKRADADRG